MKDFIKKNYGYLFLVWFIVSFIAMIIIFSITSNTTEWILIFIGQYFFVFSLIAMSTNKDYRKLSLFYMFPIVGIFCLISGIYMIIEKEYSTFTIDDLCKYALLFIFLLIGIFLIKDSLDLKSFKKKCTYKINAICVSTNVDYLHKNKGERTMRPIYNFWFNDKEYKVSTNIINKNSSFVIGKSYEIFINPNNPNEFFDSNMAALDFVNLILGIIFIITSISTILAMIFLN